jgi:hypothetical protein
MRTINATLKAALASGSFDFYVRLSIYYDGAYSTYKEVLGYKLTGTELEVTCIGLIPASNTPDQVQLVLTRGIHLDGSDYYLQTGKFTPVKGQVRYADNIGFITSTIQASLVPPKKMTLDGDVTYAEIIDAFCDEIGKTAVLYRDTDDYWGYQFLPDGRDLITNNAQSFLTLLRQKYFIFARDNGDEEIFFYHALAAPSTMANISPAIYEAGIGYYKKRRFLSRDEGNTVHYAGTATDPIHNLGFIRSTDSAPGYYSQRPTVQLGLPICLDYEDGDAYNIDGGNFYLYPALVTEIFDTKHSPAWYLTIRQMEYFADTEGGALPSTIEAAAPYTPLNVSTFNKVLSANDNNIQAAMQTLDDHAHSEAETLQILSGNVNCYVGNTEAQTIPTGALTVLTWDLEIFDSDSMFDPEGDLDRIAINHDGVYLVYAQVEFAANATGRRAVVTYAHTGGTDVALGTGKVMCFTDAGATTCLQVIGLYALGAGDYVYAKAFQASGGDLDVSAAQSYFAEVRII